MKKLTGKCKKCEKPIEWMCPVGGRDQDVSEDMNHYEAQVFMKHSVICGACKTENILMVDRVTLKVV